MFLHLYYSYRLSDLWIEVRSVLTPIRQGSSQVSGSSQLSSKDVFLSKAEAKKYVRLMPFPRWCSYSFLASLCTKSNASFFKQEIVCVIVTTITTIVMDNHSWCYPACSQCHIKTDIETMPFMCPCGKDNHQPVLRSLVHCSIGITFINYFFLHWYVHWQV